MERPHLLLIPGLLCTAELWRHQIAELAPVAAITVARHDHVDDMAALAGDILGEAPETFALAGLSMGGYIALEMFRQAPERIERLALLDTKAMHDTDTQLENRRRQIALAREGGFGQVVDELVPVFLSNRAFEEEEIRATAYRMASDVGAEGFIRQQKAMISRRDSTAVLSGISAPGLVLCGALDELTPPAIHEAMAEAMPAAEFVVVPDCGHLSCLEQPRAVSEALRRWLEAS